MADHFVQSPHRYDSRKSGIWAAILLLGLLPLSSFLQQKRASLTASHRSRNLQMCASPKASKIWSAPHLSPTT